MKHLFIILSALFSTFALAQSPEVSIVAKVEKDRIRLKWFPASYEQMRQLVNKGAIIDRVELRAVQDAKTVDFTGAKQVTIAPVSTRLLALSAEGNERKKAEALLEPFILAESPAEKEGRNFAFVLVTLETAVSASFGKLLGSEWTDEDIAKGKVYAYRIRIEGAAEARIVVNAGQITRYPEIDNFTVLLDQKKAVELRWKAERYKDFGFGFQLEKAMDAPKGGGYLTETPYVPARTADEKRDKDDFFRDLQLQEGRTHYYRLVGLNYFGEPVMFSEWQKIYVPNHVHAEVFIDSIFTQDEKRVIIGGATSAEKRPMNIVSYSLLRSLKKDVGFELLESQKSSDSSFRFEVVTPKTGDRFYYKVVAMSQDKDSAFSLPSYFFTLDQEPPGSPFGLTGTIDSLGVVRLSWQAPADADLQGYRIFRANAKKEEFNERNTVLSIATAFKDTVTLNNLTSEIYYCIKAVDQNYNNSGFSDTLLLLKLDTIAPVPTSLAIPTVADSTIVLSWYNSPSTDIAHNYLFRSAGGGLDTLLHWSGEGKIYGMRNQGGLGKLENPAADDFQFYDGKIEPGQRYAYFVQSIDKTGNTALSEQRSIYYEPGFRKAPEVRSATIDEQAKAIMISWEVPAGTVFSYQIYRTKNDGKPQLYKTIEDPTVSSFTDKQISIGNMYKYSVKYILTSGIHSLPSKEVTVNY